MGAAVNTQEVNANPSRCSNPKSPRGFISMESDTGGDQEEWAQTSGSGGTAYEEVELPWTRLMASSRTPVMPMINAAAGCLAAVSSVLLWRCRCCRGRGADMLQEQMSLVAQDA